MAPLDHMIEAIERELQAAREALWPEQFERSLYADTPVIGIGPGDIVVNERTGVRYEYREPNEWRPITVWRWRRLRFDRKARRIKYRVTRLADTIANLRVIDRRDEDRGAW